MKRKLKLLAAALSAASVMSCMSFSAYADRLKAADGLTYRYSDSGESKGLFTGWAKTSKGYYYYLDGKLLTSKWLKVSGVRTYYVDGTGRRVTGVNEIKGTKYFFGADGKLIDDGGDEWHITSRMIEVTADYMEVQFTQHFNETGAEYVLYPSYRLEQKVDGKWVNYEKELFDEMDWDDYLTEFNYPDEDDGSDKTGSVVPSTATDTLFFPKTLPIGEYRAVMHVGEFKDGESNYRNYYIDFAVTETTPNKLGIWMTAKGVTKKGMTAVIHQQGGRVYGELSGGLYFRVEKKNDKGEWEELKYAHDDIGFDDLGIRINPEKQADYEFEMKIDWEYMYGSLKKGEYRIVKQFFDFIKPGPQTYINAYGYFTI